MKVKKEILTKRKIIKRKDTAIAEINNKTDIMMTDRVELLSPAGSLDICKAVINAGADAVYLGGKSFSARAYAGNLGTDEIIRALEYAHLRGAKIYLTVNTLFKENEISRIIPFIEPLYEAGLDAVIVQDYGCMKLIRETFPDLSIHASTQMAVMTHFFVGYLKDFGVERVVLPREITLDEIKDIYDKTGIELEVFVHGALCYSYSGLCLFSSMHGSRSGNRGSCAQPCRLKFEAESSNGHLLCTKDIAALKLLPDIIFAGAKSLKIEGRMKNVYYAAGVTHIYRKYIDSFYTGDFEALFLAEGEGDLKKLAALYNRGAFSEGMFEGETGRAMMSFERANNRGVAALKVIGNNGGHISFRALEEINPGDVFEIKGEKSYTSGEQVKRGEVLETNLPYKYGLKKGCLLYRMNDAALQGFISERFVKNEKLVPVEMILYANVGREARLKLIHTETGIDTSVYGEMVQAAKSKGATAQELKARLCKLGGTGFVCKNVKLVYDDNIFISNGGVNDLRRRGIEELSARVRSLQHRKKSEKNKKNNFLFANTEKNVIIPRCMPERTVFSVQISTCGQMYSCLEYGKIRRVYIPVSLLRKAGNIEKLKAELHKSGKEIYIALPYFWREKYISIFEEDVRLAVELEPEGFLVRSADQLCMLSEIIRRIGINTKYKVVTDYQFYAYNDEAAVVITELARKCGFIHEFFTVPTELTGSEITDIGITQRCEAVCYGRMILMLDGHCIRGSVGKCNREDAFIKLKGEKGETYIVKLDCRFCGNVIYDSAPVFLLDEFINKVGIKRLRIDLTDESDTELRELMKCVSEENYVTKPGYSSGRFYTAVL